MFFFKSTISALRFVGLVHLPRVVGFVSLTLTSQIPPSLINMFQVSNAIAYCIAAPADHWLHKSSFALLSTSKTSRPRISFAERFKYDVISSSLLSASLAAAPLTGTKPLTPDISGRLDIHGGDGEHSRTSSTTVVQPDDDYPSSSPRQSEPSSETQFGDLRGSVGVVSVAVVALAAGYEFLAYLLLAIALYSARAGKLDPEKADAAELVSAPCSPLEHNALTMEPDDRSLK